MAPDSDFSPEQFQVELIRGITDTVADLPGLSPTQRVVKIQTATYSVMGFMPRDTTEIMLTGHCMMYDHMLRDGTRDLLRGEAADIKRPTRAGLNATGTMFLRSLAALKSLQKRPIEEICALPISRQIASPSPKATPPATSAPPVAHNPPVRETTPPPAAVTQTDVPQHAGQQTAAKPHFVCETVHPPRRPDPNNPPKFGAAFRLPRENPRTESFRARLMGPSHAALSVAARSRPMASDPRDTVIASPGPAAIIRPGTETSGMPLADQVANADMERVGGPRE